MENELCFLRSTASKWLRLRFEEARRPFRGSLRFYGRGYAFRCGGWPGGDNLRW
ncbi:hypothetical protein CCACVL1_20097 [Corchorus capsularis]|uniref:Uncharacterized protein n=1 Tax=Corchorus capsularis TaxID=210143 RepID=A0A1R3HCL0_COCAP|nr:hypothetical protein CCACVL1_20097 [Corchorus capsularis]